MDSDDKSISDIGKVSEIKMSFASSKSESSGVNLGAARKKSAIETGNKFQGNGRKSSDSSLWPASLPRISVRSILMNSPFSKRNRIRRGAPSKSSKKSSDESSYSPTFNEKDSTSIKSTSSFKQNYETKLNSQSNISSENKPLCMASTSQNDDFLWELQGHSSQSNISNIKASSNGSLSELLEKNSQCNTPTHSYSSESNKTKMCPLCLQDLELNKFQELITCSHSSCLSCMKQYLIIEITESRVNISCPQCHKLLHPSDIHKILNNSILSYKYEDFMIRRVLAKDPDARWCPAPDCGYAVIASGCASCPKLKCERLGCESYFCYHCKAEWHPNQTCDMARAQRFPNAPFSSALHLQDIQNSDNMKACPHCRVLIVKMDDGSCNHMTCSMCLAEFCWLCMKEITDLHYLSPSGCTFWGKKPWSRKKVIMWQIGTLIGAPVGIGLLAGLALPAMIIGIPIWVGRKLHSRFNNLGKHKRNLTIFGGVTASALVAPAFALLTTILGVPILLAYVYGVVPISLCRSGFNGVASTFGSGVRIAFDSENEVIIGISGKQSGEQTQSMAGNPSIGEVSCGASLSAESGAHLLSESDRESASNTAIAPYSLTGSIASSCLSRTHRTESRVAHGGNRSLASVATHSSLTSDRYNCSDYENASTKALSGSILRYKVTETEAEIESTNLCKNSRNYLSGDSVSGVVSTSQTTHHTATCNQFTHPDFNQYSYPDCNQYTHSACNQSSHSGADAISVDASSLHSGIDVMRLDSVSAIIKAKGVTFTDTDDEIFENYGKTCASNSYIGTSVSNTGASNSYVASSISNTGASSSYVGTSVSNIGSARTLSTGNDCVYLDMEEDSAETSSNTIRENADGKFLGQEIESFISDKAVSTHGVTFDLKSTEIPRSFDDLISTYYIEHEKLNVNKITAEKVEQKSSDNVEIMMTTTDGVNSSSNQVLNENNLLQNAFSRSKSVADNFERQIDCEEIFVNLGEPSEFSQATAAFKKSLRSTSMPKLGFF